MSQPVDVAMSSAYRWRLHRNVLIYVGFLLSLIAAMAWAERSGLSRNLIGPIFLFSTVMIYALIGIAARTTDEDEYYVAGRRIPAMYNGMATAADWMSAASFISLAGALYLQGFSGSGNQPGGLAYVMGWTGGFCLVALLIAPQLRAMRLYTLPDYFDQRYGGRWPRVIAALASVLCSFTYVVAQIYGIGLIASRLTGVQFEIGILLGLGGVLLCSFLGGMRAITWTQVAQYIMLLLAFLIPVSWLAYKQLGTSGGGNHFVEFGYLDFEQADEKLRIPKGRYLALLTHSGSRGFGATIAGHYTQLAKKMCKLPYEAQNLAYLDLNSEAGQGYWLAMNLAGDYASACHEVIHNKIAQAIGAQVLAKVENHHNFAWKEQLNGEEVIVHRKGATPAGKDVMGIIPGSMTAPGFLVRGKGEQGAINSASHGAGRQMSRTQAIKTITNEEMSTVLSDAGVVLLGAGLDEAPMAYKDIHTVMAAQTDLVDVVAKFTPKMVRMANDGSRED